MRQPAPLPLRQRIGLAAVVLAQCLGTSLWFSPAGAAAGLMARWQLQASDFAWLLASTQMGFIAGTLLIALTGAADRFRASRVFALSCALGALANALVVWPALGFASAWLLRFAVGICLAGIYPLGMKLVVQWVGGKPALALAWLVGMLTLGTAMPHVLRAIGVVWPWEAVLLGASGLALLGGAWVAGVGDGSFKAAAGPVLRLDARGLRALGSAPALRASAGGYFGHMWELYAFWSVVPTLGVAAVRGAGSDWMSWAPWLIAAVIGVGALGCLLGGYAARRWGSPRVAFCALAGSGLVCAIYPLLPPDASGWRVALLLAWGFLVIPDSPQFSAMSSQAAPAAQLGLALVVQNGMGFFISVLSIVLLGYALPAWGESALWLLLPGPMMGLWAMRGLLNGRLRI